jgi:hypothetical protein
MTKNILENKIAIIILMYLWNFVQAQWPLLTPQPAK